VRHTLRHEVGHALLAPHREQLGLELARFWPDAVPSDLAERIRSWYPQEEWVSEMAAEGYVRLALGIDRPAGFDPRLVAEGRRIFGV
jgi:hypothetical protein